MLLEEFDLEEVKACFLSCVRGCKAGAAGKDL